MSDTYSQTVVRDELIESAPSQAGFWRRWPKWIFFLAVFLWAGSVVASFAVEHSRLRKKLTAHLEAAFGRPVDVGSYSFRVWGGPSLEAQSVTVDEDPRFGHEYFLRADSITMRLRLRSLFRGHIEFGMLSLEHPSLNVVRNAAGDWNLAEWLPRPAQGPSANVPVGPVLPSTASRFRRIEVDDGRINFKRGDEKLPLAFVGVSGAVDTDGPGRWRLDLEATPWRAAALVQQAGTVHVSGRVGGTSSRLRPATLDLSWTDASISDVLRLVRGNDYGVRGALTLSLSARTHDQDAGWTARGRAEFRQVHRWDLVSRPDNPSVNLIAQADWRGAAADIELKQVALEAPHSNAYATGRVSWNRGPRFGKRESPPAELTVFSSRIDLGDLLAWVRAFDPGVADDVSARGFVGARATLAGWPVRAVDATAFGDGADLASPSLPVPAHLGRFQLHYDRGIISFLPATISFGPSGAAAGSFELSNSTKPIHGVLPGWRVAGKTTQVRDLISAAAALGWNVSRGWVLAGPFACDLTWRGAHDSWRTQPLGWPVGWIELGAPTGEASGAFLRAPFLNQPVEQIHARADLKPSGAGRVALASAQLFGTRWTGSFDRPGSGGEWRFSLSAGRLAAADLDRWLNPRWRESFLDRMLPFLNARVPAVAVPEDLRATGRLSLDQFVLAPLSVRRVQGDLKIAGRHIELTNATGQFYGGSLGGFFTADLGATPAYHAELNFSRADVPALIAATPSLAGLAAESAAGEISFDARGATRADLAASLACQGKVRVAGPELLGVDLWKSLAGPASGNGSTRFLSGSATFSCSQRRIEFQNLLLSSLDTDVQGSGTVDFNRNLDLRLHVAPAPPGRPAPVYRLTGTLAAPRIAPVPPPRAGR